MKIRTGAGMAAMLLMVACARGEDARPIENTMVADDAANNASDALDDADAADDAASSGLPTDSWIGKWIGVEGLVLDIQPTGDRGHYMLSVTLLDGTKSYEGTADGDMIRFTRNGRPESIRAANGDQTGLKWLAGKTNCLMIQQGEGFCRDDVGTKPAGDAAPQPAVEPVARP